MKQTLNINRDSPVKLRNRDRRCRLNRKCLVSSNVAYQNKEYIKINNIITYQAIVRQPQANQVRKQMFQQILENNVSSINYAIINKVGSYTAHTLLVRSFHLIRKETTCQVYIARNFHLFQALFYYQLFPLRLYFNQAYHCAQVV